uniref:Uncharacterized protein n=1 Tax=Arundo donax TaxID=35708 RepID=A0A0A8ZIT4_ARUDO
MPLVFSQILHFFLWF